MSLNIKSNRFKVVYKDKPLWDSESNTNNYGVGGLMDFLCGTGYSAENKEKKRSAKKRS